MLKWYYYVLFAIVALSALSMTWWSMYDLGVHVMSLPPVVAGITSSIFDIGGLYMGLLSIQYARTHDSGFWTELGAFSFITASVYIVSQHGVLLDYPTAGVFMFAAAPVVLGIILKATLNYLARQHRRETGRIADKLPAVGWLTWVRYTKPSWTLMSVAMKKRLIDAAGKLDMGEDRHAIFAGQMDVQTDTVKAPEIVKELTTDRTPELVHMDSKRQDLIPVRTESDIDEIVYIGHLVTIPDWLPKEPTMSLGRIAEICVENGQTDTNTILQWAKDIKHSDVKYGSMYKAVQRARQKV